jgi:undecaprenyl-diphosphatase
MSSLLTYLGTLDISLLQYIRTLAPTSATSIYILQVLAEAVVIYIALYLVWIWLYGVYTREDMYKKISLQIAFSVVFVFVAYFIINLGIPQFRISPQEVSGAIAAIIPHAIDNSFPSGHALFSMAAVIGMYRYAPRTGIWAYSIYIVYILAVVTPVCRVLGGIHYPGDILGGYIVAIVISLSTPYILGLSIVQKYIIDLPIRIAKYIRL